MTTAQISIVSPVYFAAGETLNGAVLAEAQWVRSGTAEVAVAKAAELERDGYAHVLSVGGVAYTWASCCGGSHDHD